MTKFLGHDSYTNFWSGLFIPFVGWLILSKLSLVSSDSQILGFQNQVLG